jgi:hypothetical protein
MGDDRTAIDAAVVGAGTFGLGISFHLKRLGIQHRITPASRTAARSSTQRRQRLAQRRQTDVLSGANHGTIRQHDLDLTVS